jgi:uncharacterized protein (DUF433 family)
LGAYTAPDISLILKIPQHRIRWYIDQVWDPKFGKRIFGERYSWDLSRGKAVNFLVLVEFKVVLLLRGLGLSTRRILMARNEIAKDLRHPYPFASARLLANAHDIWYRVNNDIVNADRTHQMNFSKCVEDYCRNIEFAEDTAIRLWPAGKESTVVVDPRHQFGQPVIEGTNIMALTLFQMHLSGESVPTLSRLYEITEKEVEDALKFYGNAA